MTRIQIPIAEEWYPKKVIATKLEENDSIFARPCWVKVEFREDGVPYLSADSSYIWDIKPIARKVYNHWLEKALEENETIYSS